MAIGDTSLTESNDRRPRLCKDRAGCAARAGGAAGDSAGQPVGELGGAGQHRGKSGHGLRPALLPGTSDPADEADWIEEGETDGPPDPGASTSATIPGLTAGAPYRVQVRAANSIGESPWSASGVVGIVPDAIPQAWLARFGRTVTDQAVDAVTARLAAPRRAGAEAALAGRALAAGAADDDAAGAGSGLFFESRAMTPRELLTGASFALTAKAGEEAGAGGGFASVWGRGAVSGFDGREGGLSLDGEVATGFLGADWTQESGSGSGAGGWTAGLAVGAPPGQAATGTGAARAASRRA